ncbi:hypothetical protein V6Z12_D12G276100 [Gossypium hirsutum]
MRRVFHSLSHVADVVKSRGKMWSRHQSFGLLMLFGLVGGS